MRISARNQLVLALEGLKQTQTALENYFNEADLHGSDDCEHLAHAAVSVTAYVHKLASDIDNDLNG